jgi:hypothetical protein
MADDDLQARIKRLEDIEAIKQLKARYMLTADQNDQVGWSNTFAVDGVFDGGPFGRHAGRATLAKLQHLPFAVHMVMNPIIAVDGDRATGSWYILEPCTFPEEGAIWGAARYEDEYVRENGEWKIKYSKLIPFFYTPYDQGWEKRRMIR